MMIIFILHWEIAIKEKIEMDGAAYDRYRVSRLFLALVIASIIPSLRRALVLIISVLYTTPVHSLPEFSATDDVIVVADE